MKKNLNVIQINGIRGLILSCLIVCCLAAGFIAFPGWICMHVWNVLFNHINAQYMTTIPNIGLIQGILLWGIAVVSYFAFRKNRLIVCFKTPQGLSEDELKTVFADLKDQARDDMIMNSMIKTNDIENRIKKLSAKVQQADKSAEEDNK